MYKNEEIWKNKSVHSEFLLNIHILSVVGHFLVGFYFITTKHIREKNFETQQKQFGKYCEGNFGSG